MRFCYEHAPSQNRDERLRRRRERERTRRAGETTERRERRLRQRGESGTELDALHKVRRGGRVHCSTCALQVVRLASETAEEREARGLTERLASETAEYRGRPGCNR